MDTQAHRHTDAQIHKHTDAKTHKHTSIQSHTRSWKHQQTKRQKEKEKHKNIQTDKRTDRNNTKPSELLNCSADASNLYENQNTSTRSYSALHYLIECSKVLQSYPNLCKPTQISLNPTKIHKPLPSLHMTANAYETLKKGNKILQNHMNLWGRT